MLKIVNANRIIEEFANKLIVDCENNDELMWNNAIAECIALVNKLSFSLEQLKKELTKED